MGVFLPEPSNEWKAKHVYVTRESVIRSFKKVRGSFRLSDGTITKWVLKRGMFWYDHNDKCPENVALTRNRIRQILEEASAPNVFNARSMQPEVLGGPAVTQEVQDGNEDEDDNDDEA